MKNYTDSDYAVNKYSNGIVYKFNDGAHELSLEEFLASEPSLTERDFQRWRRLSRIDYYAQVRDENRQTKKNIPLALVGDQSAPEEMSTEELFVEASEQEYAHRSLAGTLHNDILTEVQYQRFVLHFVKGYSLREIAKLEGVFFTSVAESINAAVSKLKKHFPNY